MNASRNGGTAVVPGSYDPVTYGHIDIITRVANVFDRVIVGVVNQAVRKGKTVFSAEERVSFIEPELAEYGNVQVKAFDTLLVDFAREHGAKAIVKGLRAISDFEYEFEMNQLNRKMAPEIESMYMMAAPMVGHVLERIESLNPSIGAFVAVDAEAAPKEAAAVDEMVAAGEEVGALGGIPIGVKDLEDAAGSEPRRVDGARVGPAGYRRLDPRRTAAGSRLHRAGQDEHPRHGWKADTENKVFGVTRQPVGPRTVGGRFVGGSAAAIASGWCRWPPGPTGAGRSASRRRSTGCRG